MRIIVTTGFKHIDIDGYACVLAYTDLLQKEGKNALAVIEGSFNYSVIADVRQWPATFLQNTQFTSDDRFVVLDVSEKEYFAHFAKEEQIIAVYDHHYGFESYWENKVGVVAKIAQVGACATIIVEEAQAKRLLPQLEKVSLNLLYTAIFANSLNLQASITHERDIKAMELLKPLITLPENWIEHYFITMQQESVKDPVASLENDFKYLEINGEKWGIGQFELWDAKPVLAHYQQELNQFLQSRTAPRVFLSVASIKEGVTYTLCNNEETKQRLIMYAQLPENGVLPRLRLRKEWIRCLIEQKSA